MHWQANLRHGPIVTSDDAAFSSLDADEVVWFGIVGRKGRVNVVVWQTDELPIVYARRETPNEVVHVVATSQAKVFVFEGTGQVIEQAKWGSGIFSAVPSD